MEPKEALENETGNDIDIDNDISTECPICLSNLSTEDTSLMKCCKQSMHTRCYMQCISQNKSCPLCRNIDDHRTLINQLLYQSQQSHTIINIPTRHQDTHVEASNAVCHKIGMFVFSAIIVMYTMNYLHR